VEVVKTLDPDRPFIKGSYLEDDLQSGDSHNYAGSISGAESHYTDIYGTTEKLNTEFGIDAPPCEDSLRREPRLYNKLMESDCDITAMQLYQTRLLQYYIEHYRLGKYNPCSGYMQFMFIDLCPQSFMGIYDWRGMPKPCLHTIEQINQPVAICMKYNQKVEGLWVVNDTTEALIACRAEWIVLNGDYGIVTQGEKLIDVPADDIMKVCDGSDFGSLENCTVKLFLYSSEGRIMAENVYHNPLQHPARPKGHPKRISHELGMRLFSQE
jgi:beta-mannosidase